MTTHTSIFAQRLRPLAAALATLCATSTATWALPVTHAKALPSPHVPANLVVGNCNDNGAESLRNVVTRAASNDTVDLSQLNCSRITLTTGALVIVQSNLNIVGPGQNKLAIDGANSHAVLYHVGDGTLSVSGLSILNGNTYSAVGNAAGACVHAKRNLLLENVTVSHCTATAGANQSALGGAVWVNGDAAIVNSTISDSSAVGHSFGGGIYVANNLYMRGSTITQNVASNVGGGLVALGEVNISESLVSANHAKYFGGLDLEGGGHPSILVNSTISGNTAAVVGGIASSAPLYLYNSTIAFNNSSVWKISDGGLPFAAGVFATDGGILSSTIISNNVNTGAPYATTDLTGVGTFSGESNNVMYCDVGCPDGTTFEDPGLRPLQDNGGRTKTHRPTPGPWDKFHGINRRGTPWDQRGVGFPRTSPGDPIEIGAFQTNSGIIFVNGFN